MADPREPYASTVTTSLTAWSPSLRAVCRDLVPRFPSPRPRARSRPGTEARTPGTPSPPAPRSCTARRPGPGPGAGAGGASPPPAATASHAHASAPLDLSRSVEPAGSIPSPRRGLLAPDAPPEGAVQGGRRPSPKETPQAPLTAPAGGATNPVGLHRPSHFPAALTRSLSAGRSPAPQSSPVDPSRKNRCTPA